MHTLRLVLSLVLIVLLLVVIIPRLNLHRKVGKEKVTVKQLQHKSKIDNVDKQLLPAKLSQKFYLTKLHVPLPKT